MTGFYMKSNTGLKWVKSKILIQKMVNCHNLLPTSGELSVFPTVALRYFFAFS